MKPILNFKDMYLINSSRFKTGGGFVQDGIYTYAELDDLITNQNYIPIANATELFYFRNNASEIMGLGTDWEATYTLGSDKNYVVIYNIDYESGSWQGFGTGNAFTGVFDGNQVTVSNIVIGVQTGGQSFLGQLNGATVRNVKLNNITSSYGCGLATYCDSSTLVEYCTVHHGECIVSGSQYGGIVGVNYGTIQYCNTFMNLTSSGGAAFGGIVGNNFGDVIQCYSSGTINMSTYNYAGGICATVRDSSTVINCRSDVNVSGNSIIGGAVGQGFLGGIITNCLSVGVVSASSSFGGFCGSNSATITACYYDTTTSGQSDTGKGEPKTTTEMQQGSIPDTTIYVGWSSLIWDAVDNTSYPVLINTP